MNSLLVLHLRPKAPTGTRRGPELRTSGDKKRERRASGARSVRELTTSAPPSCGWYGVSGFPGPCRRPLFLVAEGVGDAADIAPKRCARPVAANA
mmetsp:Transcript_43661/g.121435  ORF Transcript_43661/g.121435 Transcript_43661/m.121435 type:complete len:95 (+) Transcript_43661:2-286(+)